jgi:hypothetical protein
VPVPRPPAVRGSGPVLVHQVHKLANLGDPGPGQPAWAAKMAKMRRKAFTVCATCYDAIRGQPAHHTAQVTRVPRAPKGCAV